MSNAIYISQYKGNLWEGVEGPLTSQGGKTYWKLKLRTAGTHSRACFRKNTVWTPVILFGEAGKWAADNLGNGDYVNFTNARMNVGQSEDITVYKDKDGYRAKGNSLLVYPVDTEEGVVVPITILSKDPSKNKSTKSTKQEAPKGSLFAEQETKSETPKEVLTPKETETSPIPVETTDLESQILATII